MYEKILVPVDGSEHSKRALKEAIKLAKMTGGAITLLNVNPSGSSMASSHRQPKCEMVQNKEKGVLVEGQKIAETEGILVETLLLEGQIVQQIVKTAKEGHYDLIVVGARGLSKLEEIMLGSVSHGVTETATCPVIVTR
ncbi:MAG TPA: universal stress protein [Candidatus Bathyarchaeia archaeon]